ncbi:Proteasome subunit beta type-7 [Wickerhamiella sorbophila]|uniref:Proteasome subunit beta n=1 Tax=Wickerhamiella sorbophila TaxID=45607 RepID=A0A2T0FMM0_9ASCO|nr:Proteasome subunit beta type-7 [Wickerhamiella sorbophila]PRT56226.1 Proteasome subunit beta type-7 [Wickerhamiella sorbophila]
MEHHQANWGRPRNDVYGEYDFAIHNAGSHDEPTTRTLQPTVTGSSVIGIKFDKGVILAADTLASYGSLRRFVDEQRLFQVGDQTVVGISGDVSDMQNIQDTLDQLEIEANYDADGYPGPTAPSIHMYLRRLLYYQRSRMDPLWNSILVAGFKNDEPYLAYVDLLGVTYQSGCLATGFGNYLAIPLLRKLVDNDGDEKNVTYEQARKAIEEAMKVLFYRDGRATDTYHVAVITKEAGVQIEKTKCENMSWKFASQIKGFGTQKE